MTDDRSPKAKKTKKNDAPEQYDKDDEKQKSKSELPFWTTRIMAEDFGREAVLEATLKEMIIYTMFLIIATTMSLGMTSKSMFYLTRVMQDHFLQKEFSTVNDEKIKFEQIRTPTDFLFYAETILIDCFYGNEMYNGKRMRRNLDDGNRILVYNKMLGVPRFRQLKVRNDSCLVHPVFRRTFSTCFAAYSRQAEDTDSFGPANGTAWIYSTSQQTGGLPYKGKISNYNGGGFYQDLVFDRDNATDVIDDLKKNLWITRGTRVIFVDFSIYNANINLFCVMKLIFEFPPTGGVFTSHKFKSIKLLRYATAFDYFILACEILFVGFIIFYTLEEIRETIYLHSRYFAHFWNYIDLTILLLAYCGMFCAIMRNMYVVSTVETLKQKPAEKYENFEPVCLWYVRFNCVVAIMLFFLYIKVFKYLNFNKTMGQLNNTFKRCALDILAFSVMFFIIFFAFALLGYLLFGTQVESFSGFGVAMFTLLRTILGDFDYPEIEKANKYLAPIYFISYIFFVFFVLLNMFLAIINDTYSDVKTELELTPDEMQMTEFIKRGFYNLLRKCGCKKWAPIKKVKKNEYNITIEKIRGLLKTCGFSDLEIEMFFARYDIDPAVDVGDFDINKLMADLEQIPDDKERKRGRFEQTANIDDYIIQDERLNEMEKLINLLADKLDALLKKLDTLENVRKIPKPK